MQPDNLESEEVRAARETVRQNLGSTMARKASAAFCLNAVRRETPAFGAEALGAPPAPSASVIEFEPAATRPDLADIARQMPELPHPVRAATVLRQAVIGAIRHDGYQTISRVYDEVERLSGGSLGPGAEVFGTAEVPTLINQICWLNRTMRSWAGPRVLAEVVRDEAVTAVDVPRRLMPDADTRNHVAMLIPAYLAQHHATGDGVTVAVIDSEIALGHPALSGRIVHRRNYTAELWGNADAHGTAVAGIIAGDDPVNGGLAPGAIIYNYKVLATNRFLHGDDFSGAIAIQQALEDGVDIANCSWGAGPIGTTLSREARAVDTAWAAGLTVVKSAGNGGPKEGTMTTPADASGIIVVGATDIDGILVPRYSSRGPAGPARPGPDVLAPGGDENVRLACCLTAGGFGDAGYGTSYAAPHVTGLLALFLQEDPSLLPDQLRDRLRQHARLLGGFGAPDQGDGLAQAA